MCFSALSQLWPCYPAVEYTESKVPFAEHLELTNILLWLQSWSRPAYSLASVAHSTEFLLSHWFTLVHVHRFRFALVAEDGVVKAINVEPDGTGLTCSKAADVMKLLWCLHRVAPAAKLPLCTCILQRVWAAPLCSHQSQSRQCHLDTS